MLLPRPDARDDLKSAVVDEAHDNVAAYATIHGAHTGPQGLVELTGRAVSAADGYVKAFQQGPIKAPSPT